MYVAIKHIGNQYTPGETISESIPADTLEWLKAAGAVREIASAATAPIRTEIAPIPDERAKATGDAETEGSIPSDDAEEDEIDEEEIDEEAEAPEIDIMDGLVSEQEEEPKTTRATPRKAQAIKSAKGGKAQ